MMESHDKEIKTDLNSTLKSSGQIKTGRKTAHDFDESVLTKTQSKTTFKRSKPELCSLKAKSPLFPNSSLLQANTNLDRKSKTSIIWKQEKRSEDVKGHLKF